MRSEMIKDLFGVRERAKERASRKWRNNELSARFKKIKATGEGADQFLIRDGKKFFSTEVPKLPKEALPQPAEIIETNKPKAQKFETKFKKEIRKMLDEHKEISIKAYLAILAQQKRRLLKEKIRRLELSIAEHEARITQREGAKS
jgi:hypothetical protein